MPTQSMGNMQSVKQTVSARSHGISLPPVNRRRLARTAMRVTKVDQTEAGYAAKKTEDAIVMTGIPIATLKAKAIASAKAAAPIAASTQTILMKNGTLQKRLNVDLTNERSVAALLNEMDKFASNHNINNLSKMSTGALEKKLKQLNPNSDIYKVVKNTISLKKHQHSLLSLRLSTTNLKVTALRFVREKTKDLDGANTGMAVADTVISARRTIKSVKSIARRLSKLNSTRTAGATKGGARATPRKPPVNKASAASAPINKGPIHAANIRPSVLTKATSVKATAVGATSTGASAATGMTGTAAATGAAGAGATASTAGASATVGVAGAGATAGTAGAAGVAGAGATAGTAGAAAAAGAGAGTAAGVGAGAAGAGAVASGPIGIAVVAIAAVVAVLIVVIPLLTALFATAFVTLDTGFLVSKDDDSNRISPEDSLAAIVYNNLRAKDSAFIDEVTGFSDETTPSAFNQTVAYGYWDPDIDDWSVINDWSAVSINWKNGNNEMLENISNAKEIICAANIFTGQDPGTLKRTYEIYANQLWKDTHVFSKSASERYACDNGCATRTYKCTDSGFYSNVSNMKIKHSNLVSYSSTGCYRCRLTYCSGCETVNCEGYHDGVECTGHVICSGHLKYGSANCNNKFYYATELPFDCSGCVFVEVEVPPTDPDDSSTTDPSEPSTTIISQCPYDGVHTVSTATPACLGHCSSHEITLCLGHMDLNLDATVYHISDETKSLYDVDSLGKVVGEDLWITPEDEDKELYSWDGWTQNGKDCVEMLMQVDWYKEYGVGESDSAVFSSTPVSSEVLSYTDVIEEYAGTLGISEYVLLVQAVMMQESGGRGNDPMQASECEYNTKYPNVPNGITDPTYSIYVGMQNLADCLKRAGVSGPSDIERIKLALQGYNYGPAYISWAQGKYGGYSLDNAAEYSNMMANKMGWSGYGDKQYVSHVLRYYSLHTGNTSIVEVALKEKGNVGGEKFWSWWGYSSRVPWCAIYVSWCANESGYLSTAIPKFENCPWGANWFKYRDQWANNSYVPTAGDIIFFDWENDGISDHVGIVTKTVNGIVYTIEGNSSDACKEKQYAVGSSLIYGYGLPKYPN